VLTPNDYAFRAPRYGDLVGCPYCDPDSLSVCDHCGGEGVMFASEVFERCESHQMPLTGGGGGKKA
jgi:hypothetical protein